MTTTVNNRNHLEIEIREAIESDFSFIVNLMKDALSPFYGGDHEAHAKRIFYTHISGGKDLVGHFSTEQKMFILTVNGEQEAMIHMVGKRQGTYKISPLIVSDKFRGHLGFGKMLLIFAENYARGKGARQVYCTVAKQNATALKFFLKYGYVICGVSESHYKIGISETMLYKLFVGQDFDDKFDRPNISVLLCQKIHEPQVRDMILSHLPRTFSGIDNNWIDALFRGYAHLESGDVNKKFKIIFVAINRTNEILGVAGATPKKGSPIKIMPLIAKNLSAFTALITDLPFILKEYGHKLYTHITPTTDEVIALQQRGWKLDSAMPAAYREDTITQQWSVNIQGDETMRTMRVKQHLLNHIKSGDKTLEVRVAYDNILSIRQGDLIRFASRAQEHIVKISDIRKYNSFEEMLEAEDHDKIVPGISKEEVVQLLKEIYPEHLEKLGVVVLEIT